MVDGRSCFQVTVKPFHLRGLRIVGDLVIHLIPHERGDVMKHPLFEDSRIVGDSMLSHPIAGGDYKAADNCVGR
jgi:hypothetical protein